MNICSALTFTPRRIRLHSQRYSYFIRHGYSIQVFRFAIRICLPLCRPGQYSEEDPPPFNDEDIVWHTWFAVFDHLVPPGDRDPEVIQLYMLDGAKFARGRSRSDRSRVNAQHCCPTQTFHTHTAPTATRRWIQATIHNYSATNQAAQLGLPFSCRENKLGEHPASSNMIHAVDIAGQAQNARHFNPTQPQFQQQRSQTVSLTPDMLHIREKEYYARGLDDERRFRPLRPIYSSHHITTIYRCTHSRPPSNSTCTVHHPTVPHASPTSVVPPP
ncbi:hypothetical protein K458DRAFT_408719 [Lentithecium fluviatile CBS 122367]|uniref:Uncharacterized protein n=1 Tax=Lentithecium fluviatile CBS 122367 TaxID=1168545 RepID=A0A6G1IL38_9PLEO|nr:hypothetical protein K458DRAFT_408719 [Lentithecium fluviatile CBS 122367]